MLDTLLNVLSRKLATELAAVDARAESEVRRAYSDVVAAPEPPFVSQVLGPIRVACSAGYRERAQVARDVVRATVEPFLPKLSSRDGDKVLDVVREHFPPEKYVAAVASTPGVFQRREAAERKVEQGVFDLQFALVKAEAHTAAIRAVAQIKLDLDEAMLRTANQRGSGWLRALRVLWTQVAKPLVAWSFGILAVVIAAYLVWALGIR